MVNTFKKVFTAERFAVVLGCVWVIALYGPVVASPDHFMFSDSGDGTKNYFTFAYHVKHDSQWLHFEGMNYPYGEHVTFTDGHPLFSLLFGWIPWVQQYPVGFLNLCMLAGIPLAVWVVFRLLKTCAVSDWSAVAGALATVWLNPQIFRLEGHYALSYPFILPLFVWLTIRWSLMPSTTTSFGLMVSSLAVYFIHPYLGLMTTIIVSATIIYALLGIKRRKELAASLSFTVLPPLLYMGLVRLTDTHTQRSPDAKGFLDFTSCIESMAIPHHAPFLNPMIHCFPTASGHWEGWAYIGVVAMASLVLAAVWWKPTFEIMRAYPIWGSLFLVAIGATMFSFAFPFTHKPHWLEKLPLIEQFRSPGRFVWIAYYVIALFAWIFIHRAVNGRKVMPFIIVAALVVSVAEGWGAQMTVASKISGHPNLFRNEYAENHLNIPIQGLKLCNDPVIVPLPYFHYGSDYYNRDSPDAVKNAAMAVSFSTGAPLFASSNPRVSLEESRMHLNFFSNQTNAKDILSVCPVGASFYFLKIGENLREEELIYAHPSVECVLVSDLKASVDSVQRALLSGHSAVDAAVVVKNDGTRTQVLAHQGDAFHTADTRHYEIVAELLPGQENGYDTLQACIHIEFESLNAIYTSFIVERVDGEKVEYVDECPASYGVDHMAGEAWLKLQFAYDPAFKYRFFLKGGDTEWATYRWKDLYVYPERSYLLIPGAFGPDFRPSGK
jgi:hypothetical protein